METLPSSADSIRANAQYWALDTGNVKEQCGLVTERLDMTSAFYHGRKSNTPKNQTIIVYRLLHYIEIVIFVETGCPYY